MKRIKEHSLSLPRRDRFGPVLRGPPVQGEGLPPGRRPSGGPQGRPGRPAPARPHLRLLKGEGTRTVLSPSFVNITFLKF